MKCNHEGIIIKYEDSRYLFGLPLQKIRVENLVCKKCGQILVEVATQ